MSCLCALLSLTTLTAYSEPLPLFAITPQILKTNLTEKHFYGIMANNSSYGKIFRVDEYMKIDFTYYDNQDQLLAQAVMEEQNASYNLFTLTDAQEQLLGYVKKKDGWFSTNLEIYSSTEELLARAKINFWGTKCTLKPAHSDIEIAFVSRPFFCWVPVWTIKRLNNEALAQTNMDLRIFTLFLSFLPQTKTLYRLQQIRNAQTAAFMVYQQNEINNLNYQNRNGYRALLLPSSSAPFNVSELRQSLEDVRPRFAARPPTEEEMFSIEELVEDHLARQKPTKSDCDLSKKIEGLHLLLPLLAEKKWSEEDKKTLFYLLDTHLQSVETEIQSLEEEAQQAEENIVHE